MTMTTTRDKARECASRFSTVQSYLRSVFSALRVHGVCMWLTIGIVVIISTHSIHHSSPTPAKRKRHMNPS
jgi:hypothetical protein